MRGAVGAFAARRRALVDLPWIAPRQVHGNGVAVVGPGCSGELVADGLVTLEAGHAIAVLGADCALVGLASPEGVLAVAHAGWRGLLAGVLEATVATMRRLGASEVAAVLGPCIHPECYAFGDEDLSLVEARLGPSVRAETADGAPAFDLPAGVEAALANVGVAPPSRLGGCTACDERYYSHRARRDQARQALVAWRPK
jgi:YfiH family protein